MASLDEDQERIRGLAGSVDCFTEDDLVLLAKITPSTAQAWRKRGMGPAYVLIGNRFLYPKAVVADYLKTLVRGNVATRGAQ